MEEWREPSLPELKGRYEISSFGRIKRIDRISFCKDGRKRHLTEKILSPHPSPKGYMIINLSTDMGNITYKMHRLIALTFIPNPNNLPEVNHKDEDKANNRVDNLEWCTHQYNSIYGTRLQRLGEITSERQKGRKLSDEAKRKISEAHKGKKHSEEWKKNHSKKIKDINAIKKSLGISYKTPLPR